MIVQESGHFVAEYYFIYIFFIIYPTKGQGGVPKGAGFTIYYIVIIYYL